MFGEPDNGHGLMWSVGNGIPMFSLLEKTFDEGAWTLVGQKPQGQPVEYRVVVIDEYLFESSGAGIDYAELNWRKLQFKSDNRPDPKFVYWHFATSLMRYYKLQTPGIEKKLLDLVNGRAWGNTGDWYDRSTLRYMAEYWGAVAKRVFEGTEKNETTTESSLNSEESKLAAAEVFVEAIAHDCPELLEDELEELDEEVLIGASRKQDSYLR
jgi:hypothetical protein